MPKQLTITEWEIMRDDIEKEIESKYNFKIHDHNVMFYGICKDCEEKKI